MPDRFTDAKGMRWYQVNGQNLPSVTSILKQFSPESPGIAIWKQRNPDTWEKTLAQKATIGTVIHYRIHQYFAEKFKLPPVPLEIEHPDFTEEMLADIDDAWSHFLDLIASHKIIPQKNEFPTWHRRAMYAGTVDFLGWIDELFTLGDFKSSGDVYPSYEAQVEAYRLAVLSDTSYHHKIDGRAVIIVNPRRAEIRWVLDEYRAQTPKELFWNAFDAFQMTYRPQMQWIKIEEL